MLCYNISSPCAVKNYTAALHPHITHAEYKKGHRVRVALRFEGLQKFPSNHVSGTARRLTVLSV